MGYHLLFFTLLLSLPGIDYNFIWSHSISINIKITKIAAIITRQHFKKEEKKKELNMAVTTEYKEKEVVVFMWEEEGGS